jgi:hypothetical protein
MKALGQIRRHLGKGDAALEVRTGKAGAPATARDFLATRAGLPIYGLLAVP